MFEPRPSVQLQPDIGELLLNNDPRLTCETYIFEPAPTETSLGQLVAVAELENRDGVGVELRDMVMTAIQREYYRQPNRGVLPSFESALHQANLVLHDSAEQGVRDWMGYCNIAVAVLAGTTLHISVAGEAIVLLARRSRVVTVSEGLAHLPITNPLRTFSQVASGTIAARDTIFLGSANFSPLFNTPDLVRFSIEHSASTISLRLQQLYSDGGANLPVAALVVSILPRNIVEPRRETAGPASRRRAVPLTALPSLPRKPLIIHASRLRRLLATLGQVALLAGRSLRERVWPVLKEGSVRGGQALSAASQATRHGVQSLTQRQLSRWRHDGAPPPRSFPALPSWRPPKLTEIPRWPARIWNTLRGGFSNLPRATKLLSLVTLVLAVAFAASLLLLRSKRAEDKEIQRASELLHEARTKQEAAESALIYDNRDQARTLLREADEISRQLETTALYQEETTALKQAIATQHDRLQKIVRLQGDASTVLGTFESTIKNEAPTKLFLANAALFSYSPANNELVKMELDGTTKSVLSSTQEIGFFTNGVAHAADKTILLLTNQPGLALFDTTSNELLKQDIAFPATQPAISALALYGTRLYVYDKASSNIYSYSKSLRGYSGGEAWIKDLAAAKPPITSMGIDGSIYALREGGGITKFNKGEVVDFTLEPVEPVLSNAKTIVTSEELHNLYLLDASSPRIVIFNKKGVLQRQIYLPEATSLTDIVPAPDEKTLYALDGKRVLTLSLTAESAGR